MPSLSRAVSAPSAVTCVPSRPPPFCLRFAEHQVTVRNQSFGAEPNCALCLLLGVPGKSFTFPKLRLRLGNSGLRRLAFLIPRLFGGGQLPLEGSDLWRKGRQPGLLLSE